MPKIPVSQDQRDAHPDTLDFRDKMYVPGRITLARGGVGQAAVEFAPSASSLRDRRRTLV